MIDDARSNKLRKFLCFLVPLVYVAAMLPSVAGKLFPVDDPSEMDFVRGVPPLRLLTGQDAFGYFRPVKNLLWLLFSGLAPLGVEWFHVVAIAFGVLSFFPVLSLCRRISGSGWKALAAASVWLFSPTLVSSAAWLSCLNIQVMVAFAALSLVFHDKAWDGGSFHPSRVVLAGGFLFLALVSYECAIAVVPVLLLFDFILRPGRLAESRARTAHATYWTLAAVYLVLRTAASSRTGTQGLWAQADRWQLVISSPGSHSSIFQAGSGLSAGSPCWADTDGATSPFGRLQDVRHSGSLRSSGRFFSGERHPRSPSAFFSPLLPSPRSATAWERETVPTGIII